MAYLAPGQNYYGQQQQPAQQQPAGGVSGQTAFSPQAQPGNTGRKKPGTGYWTNVQSYMQSAPGAGQRMGQQAREQIGQQAQQMKTEGMTSVGQQYDTAREQAQQSLQPYEQLQTGREQAQDWTKENYFKSIGQRTPAWYGGEGRPVGANLESVNDINNRFWGLRDQYMTSHGTDTTAAAQNYFSPSEKAEWEADLASALRGNQIDRDEMTNMQRDWDMAYQNKLTDLELQSQMQGAPDFQTPTIQTSQTGDLENLLSDVQGATTSELFDVAGLGDGRTVGENVLDRLLFSSAPQTGYDAPVEQALADLTSTVQGNQDLLGLMDTNVMDPAEQNYQDILDWIGSERETYGY